MLQIVENNRVLLSEPIVIGFNVDIVNWRNRIDSDARQGQLHPGVE